MRKILIPFIFLLISLTTAYPQYSSLNAHSHNDYENDPPFMLAYNNHFGSIEADIWAVNGELFVSHNEKDINPSRTLDTLYINPIVRLFRLNGGKAWNGKPGTYQLMIDLKTPVDPTLSLLIQKLVDYPDVFDPGINKNAVRIVITGNRPEPARFKDYPSFVFFDGNVALEYSKKQLRRIALYSENFRNYSSWNGEGAINEKEKARLESIIDSVHSVKKKIRFWNTPDNADAWRLFIEMGIDYINTDHIAGLSDFLTNR